jgi:hypothetical protein
MTGPDTATPAPPPPPETQFQEPERAAQPRVGWTTRARQSAQPLIDRLTASMSRAEMLILGGALLIIAVDLAFGILIRSFIVSGVLWAAAAALLALAVLQRRAPRALPVPYRSLLVGVAGVGVLVAGRDVLADLVRILRPPVGADPAFVFGFIGLVAGAAAMAAGVWLFLAGRE